jgi:hypothetical protein
VRVSQKRRIEPTVQPQPNEDAFHFIGANNHRIERYRGRRRIPEPERYVDEDTAGYYVDVNTGAFRKAEGLRRVPSPAPRPEKPQGVKCLRQHTPQRGQIPGMVPSVQNGYTDQLDNLVQRRDRNETLDSGSHAQQMRERAAGAIRSVQEDARRNRASHLVGRRHISPKRNPDHNLFIDRGRKRIVHQSSDIFGVQESKQRSQSRDGRQVWQSEYPQQYRDGRDQQSYRDSPQHQEQYPDYMPQTFRALHDRPHGQPQSQTHYSMSARLLTR